MSFETQTESYIDLIMVQVAEANANGEIPDSKTFTAMGREIFQDTPLVVHSKVARPAIRDGDELIIGEETEVHSYGPFRGAHCIRTQNLFPDVDIVYERNELGIVVGKKEDNLLWVPADRQIATFINPFEYLEEDPLAEEIAAAVYDDPPDVIRLLEVAGDVPNDPEIQLIYNAYLIGLAQANEIASSVSVPLKDQDDRTVGMATIKVRESTRFIIDRSRRHPTYSGLFLREDNGRLFELSMPEFGFTLPQAAN